MEEGHDVNVVCSGSKLSESRGERPCLDMTSLALYTSVSAFSVSAAMHGGSTTIRRIVRDMLELT